MEFNLPVLIVDDMHPSLMEGLEQRGIAYIYKPDATRTEVLDLVSQCCGLVVRSKLQVDKTVLKQAKHLLFIARAGAGMDNLDEAEAMRRRILCLNAPEGNRDAVGEHAAGLLLSLTRRIPASYDQVKQGLWLREENRGEELTELTIGIIGFGNTGQAFAKKMSGFGCRILYYDKNLIDVPTPYAEAALLEEVYDQADVLSFHIPLDEENKGLINNSLIARVARPFYLLNLSRGGIMNTSAILEGLKSGKIKAAALDVLENEKPHTWNEGEKEMLQSMIETKRIILTPHIGGWTTASYRKISEVILAKIESLLS